MAWYVVGFVENVMEWSAERTRRFLKAVQKSVFRGNTRGKCVPWIETDGWSQHFELTYEDLPISQIVLVQYVLAGTVRALKIEPGRARNLYLQRALRSFGSHM
jgi:hypothetical protein